MPEKTLLLTDSSTFLPSTFADATGRPDRYMTLHFANQIWRNNLTELMRHDRTSDESFELAEQFSHAIGMVPLKLNKEQPATSSTRSSFRGSRRRCTLWRPV